MKDDTSREYARRIKLVIDYISSHLDEELSVERLSRIACFSKYHFHRQFSAYTGINVMQLVQLMRLKRASYQLAFNKNLRVIEIALDAGFSSPEAFARAFKKAQGQTPTEFRAHPEWEEWTRKYQYPQLETNTDMQVKIEQFSETKVAVLEHKGSPASVMASVGRFIEWRKSSKLSPKATSQTYGIPYSDPETTPPEEFHFDICGSVNAEVPANPQGVVSKLIPGGRCAVAQHVGSTDAIGQTVWALYKDWLPGSGESLRDFPCFFQYITMMPEVAEHEQVTKVYLSLK